MLRKPLWLCFVRHSSCRMCCECFQEAVLGSPEVGAVRKAGYFCVCVCLFLRCTGAAFRCQLAVIHSRGVVRQWEVVVNLLNDELSLPHCPFTINVVPASYVCILLFSISFSLSPPSNSFLEVCCAKKVGKRCFQYIEILTSHIHKYICYIYSDVCFINQSLLNLSFLIVLKYAAGRRTQDTGSRFYSWLFTALFLGYSLTLFVLWQELIGSFA